MNAASPLSSSGDRIAVVDVLRAFALFGIIITHAVTGFLAGPTPTQDFMQLTALDRAVAQLDHLFVFGKFYTVFSFLFGLSFAIQLRNATQKGVGFAGRFTWRLLVLLLIALAHGVFFTGDILIIYAFLGLLLIPFRNLKTRTLLIVALILVFNLPGMLLGFAGLMAPPSPEQMQMQAEFMAASQRAFEIKQSGTLAELAQTNFTTGLMGKVFFMIFTGRLWVTFGLFLLGMCAGRLEIFRDGESSRRFFRGLLLPSGLLALLTTVIEWLYPAPIVPRTPMDMAGTFSFTVQQISLSTFYLSAVVLLFWRRPDRGLLPSLAPLGRMGLTSYLGQSVFGILMFYGLGFGLLGKVGAAVAVGSAIAFFMLQYLFAQLWSRYFRMGPAEWLWRSLTYFKLQPNRLQTKARVVAA